MKTQATINKILLLIMTLMSLVSCQNEGNKLKPNPNEFNCQNLLSPHFIDSLAKKILLNHDSKTIWNLSSVDTVDMKVYEDNFVSASYKSKLIILQGEAGLSAGNANKLYLILTCQNDEIHLDWFGQEGELRDENFRDLDGDGIKEIIIEKSMMWMGGCEDHFEILNFQSGERNVLLASRSYSLIDCGVESFQSFKKGDTLEIQIQNTIIQDENYFVLELAREIKIYNGGLSYTDIVRRLIEKKDTVFIRF